MVLNALPNGNCHFSDWASYFFFLRTLEGLEVGTMYKKRHLCFLLGLHTEKGTDLACFLLTTQL